MRPCKVGVVPCQLYESTAADRAAADMQRGGRILKGSNSLAAAGAFLMLYGIIQRILSPCWLGAAALSAAVTLLKPIGDTPNAQAEPSQKKSTPSNANRSSGERGLGGEALLSEKRPLPPESLVRPPPSLGKGARGRGLLFREAPSLAYTYLFTSFRTSFRLGEPRRRGGHSG